MTGTFSDITIKGKKKIRWIGKINGENQTLIGDTREEVEELINNMKPKAETGEGHYFTKTLKNGTTRWVWRISIDGKIHELSSKTEAELREKVERWKELVYNQKNPNIKTLEQYLDYYIENKTNHMEPSTKDWYLWIINSHIRKMVFAILALKRLNEKLIKAELEKLKGNVSDSTIADIKRGLSAIINAAVSDGYIDKNPCKSIKMGKVEKKQVFIPSENQVKNYLNIAKEAKYINLKEYEINDGNIFLQHEFYVALIFALFTGLRRGEQYALSWDNIDFEGKQAYIYRAIARKWKNGHYTGIKNHETRWIPLPDNIINLLKKWKQEQDEYAEKYKGIYNNAEKLVFPNTFGQCMSNSTLNRGYWYKFRAYCGFPAGYHWHHMRHWACSYFLHKGLSVAAITHRLGHANNTVTLTTYSHVFEADNRDIINKDDWGEF